MADTNRTYRIRTETGINENIIVNLEQDYNSFEILSMKLTDTGSYRLQDANYGVIVGRAIANNGFGVENAKISVFISSTADTTSDEIVSRFYPYASVTDVNDDGVRYNVLSDEEIDNCHQVVGTFPKKTYLLDNDVLLEVFDTYYKYTARTNHAGDYMICGVPVGQHTLHMDLDLSDCGILSQRPRDFVYKGYTIEQFMNPNQFKTDTDLDSLSQIFTQNITVNVNPFWGHAENGETLGITRADFNISYKFEPTCVFMGCLVGDNASNGISKKCIPTENMGAMDELVTGEGTIEMIRITPGGSVEEFQVKGTQVINGDGVWCYQIPMNLDFVTHDEYGNIVPTNNPNKGIPTRTRARFRISMNDFEENTDNYFRAKVLVPHNPETKEEIDYCFGTKTKDKSYRDLYWNNVYTVKSYIPRFQKSQNFKETKFTGIKHCNIYGQNNPMPYNNIRIKLPLMFTILCVLIKAYIKIVSIMNFIIYWATAVQIHTIAKISALVSNEKDHINRLGATKYITITEGLCPDLENWYFSPVNGNTNGFIGDEGVDQIKGKIFSWHYDFNLFKNTFDTLKETSTEDIDKQSIDYKQSDGSNTVCLTKNVDYLISCIEMNLAQEYKVINFDFYNDWVNGTIYMPRWMRFVRKKATYLFGLIPVKGAIKGCMSADSDGLDPNGNFTGTKVKGYLQTRRYTQQCSLSYNITNGQIPTITTAKGCDNNKPNKQKCHKKIGLSQKSIFGSKNGGIVHAYKNIKDQFVYYFKPCEWNSEGKKVNLFANDLVLLGSLNDCSIYGLPQSYRWLSSSSFKMPTNLALTNMEDNGTLYVSSGETICSNSKIYENSGIQPASPTFAATQKAYVGTENSITYLDSEDYVPMTEAAGIAWNYTGPDQGEEDFEKNFYQPGGHFLGMSCSNSATNIKSCINLERVCEAGVAISQRHEVVRGRINGNELSYKYLVPTGLISNDEILGGDFRTMFATLNHKKLLADGVDTKTGYGVYSYTYLRPNAFDGAFMPWVSGATTPYNKNLTVGTDFYVENNLISGADPTEVADIKNNTARRTIESKNIDYYMFRLGLEGMSASEQMSKYYDSSRLPQYENSFYFYFGLKHGSTALDELNKEFFSTCSNNNLKEEM